MEQMVQHCNYIKLYKTLGHSWIFAGGLSSNTPDIHMFEYSTPDHQMEKTNYKHGSLRYPQPFSPKGMWHNFANIMTTSWSH